VASCTTAAVVDHAVQPEELGIIIILGAAQCSPGLCMTLVTKSSSLLSRSVPWGGFGKKHVPRAYS